MEPRDTRLSQRSEPEGALNRTVIQDGISLERQVYTRHDRMQSPFRFSKAVFVITAASIVIIGVVGLASIWFFVSHIHKHDSVQTSNFEPQNLSPGTVNGYDQLLSKADSLTVNGQLQVNGNLILASTTAPTAPTTGQIYYDKNSNSPYFYNGSHFLPFNGSVQGLAGQTGLQGLAGQTGLQGLNGINGASGLQGTAGLSGGTLTDTSGLVSGSLADARLSTNVALLSRANQTFTGTSQSFRGMTNVTNALQVQTATGDNVFTVDTRNGSLVLGNDGTPSAMTVRGGLATTTNASGAHLFFDASNGNGTGSSGDLVFRTASTNTGSPYLDPGSNVETGDYGANITYSSRTISDTVNALGDRLLIVNVMISNNTDTVSSITWAGQPLTKLASQQCPTDEVKPSCENEMWYVVNPLAGAYNVVVNFSGPVSNFTAISAADFANVDPVNPFGATAKQPGYHTSTTSLTAISSASQLLVDSMVDWNGMNSGPVGSSQNLSVGQQWVNTWYFQQKSPLNMTDKIANSSATTMNYTETYGPNDTWAEIAVPLNPPSASGLIDRLHITASGNVGINSDNPQYSLDVTGSGNFKTNSTHAFQIQDANGKALLIADTSGMALTVQALVINTTLTINGHIITGGLASSANVNANAGIGAVCTVSGNDTSGVITISSGSGVRSAGSQCAIQFSSAYSSVPHIQLTAGNATAQAAGIYNDISSNTLNQFNISTAFALQPPVSTINIEYFVAQ